MAKKKTETPPEQKYTVTLNERQLRLICTAAEEYGRLRMGQTWDLADALAFLHALSLWCVRERLSSPGCVCINTDSLVGHNLALLAR